MKLKSKWVYSHRKGLKGAMVSHDYHLDGDDLYFALSLGFMTLKSTLIKLNLQTQEASNIFDESHVLRTAGLVDDGKMFLTSMKGMAYCLDFDGNTIWESSIGKNNASFKMAMDDNRFYVSNYSFYCLNKENGEVCWVNDTFKEKSNCNILLDGQRLYSAELGGKVFCLDKLTGETLWTFGDDEWITNVCKLGDDRLLVNHSHGWFYVLDLKTGALIKKIPANGMLYNSPIFEHDMIYIGDQNDVIESTSGNMTCYEILPSGEFQERYKVSVEGGGISTAACLYNDKLFFGTDNGYLYCIDKNTGNELMTRKKCKGTCRNIIIRENEIILLTDKGQVECFDFVI